MSLLRELTAQRRERHRAARALVAAFIAAGGKRPACVGCGKPLGPCFEYDADGHLPMRLRGWGMTSRTGHHATGYFHSIECGWRWAERVAERQWPR